jgi:hypothetical protein
VFVRRVRTGSGAVAVQVVEKIRGRVVVIEHVGSAHTDAELGLLVERARGIVTVGQQAFDLGVEPLAAVEQMDAVADWRAVTSCRYRRPWWRAEKSVDRALETRHRGLAGLEGYTTNLTGVTAQFVIDAYHQLWHVEKAFRMSKHDLQARPIYHHKRESIDAHLTIVFAALAVGHWIEDRTGWSIKRFVQTARRCRTVEIRAGNQTLTAADPLPADLRAAIAEINSPRAH